MFSTEQAQYLLQLPKKVEWAEKLQNNIDFHQSFPFQEKYSLVSPEDPEYTFLYEINQSKKNQYKLTLYTMDADTRIGLLRVDYKGQHENPQSLNEYVPEILHPFVGKFFQYDEHHIHIYVEGYKTTLDWALPLTKYDFPIKEITNNNDVIEAFQCFNQAINLQTVFTIHPLLI